MNTSKRYSREVRERAVRLVREAQRDHSSQWAADVSISSKIGCSHETLRRWVDRIYLMREIAGQEGNFADPVGDSLERYSAAADELEKIVEDSYERITAVVGKRG